MRRSLFTVVAIAVAVASVFFALQVTSNEAQAGESDEILEFDVMVGVPRPFTGAANAIRGVSGGGLPWVIDSGEGELRVNGDIRVEVEGLVLDPNDAAVIARGLAGANPAGAFRAIVSCLSVDMDGAPITVNLMTDAFPATTGVGGGDAEIVDNVDLPDPCIAPIVFVTNLGGSWFAATGN